MRSASVGQQCVDCVGQGARSTRQARTAFGGRPAARAVVTWTLVAINVAIFLVTWVRPGIVNNLEMLGYASYGAGGPLHGVAAGEWYRLITSAFVVPGDAWSGLGFVDILFNMWALIFVGPALEGQLGRMRFLAVYLLSAVGGAVTYYFLAPQNHAAAGASGAIYGLFGAWFVVARRLRVDSRGIVTLIAINLALSFWFRSAHRVAGPYRRAADRGAPHRGLRVRATQEPGRAAGAGHGRGGGRAGDRGPGQERPADRGGRLTVIATGWTG